MISNIIEEYGKKPRIYVNAPLTENATVSLDTAQIHYFKNVLRQQDGDEIRIFNGKHGEWLAALTALKKKSGEATLQKQIKPQPDIAPKIHLLFAPIRKNRMDTLIEKAVELGVSDLHPVITDHTQHSKIKLERITTQIIEATEQCERFDIPTLHKTTPLMQKIQSWNCAESIIWACERGNHPPISHIKQQEWAFLIGPEGGFSDSEIEQLQKNQKTTPTSLGTRIYRSETAAALCLAHANLQIMA